MSYQDPYANASGGYAAGQYAPSHYDTPPPRQQQQQQQQYNDADYNPYAYSHQNNNGGDYGYAGNNYAQGPETYRDEPFSHANVMAQQPEVVAPIKERSTFDHADEVRPPLRMPKDQSARALREYRLMSQGNLWTKGGGGRTCCRFLFCTIFIGFFLFFGVVLSMALFLRPPNVTIGNPDSSQTSVNFTTAGISINLPVNISIINPNYLGLDLSSLTAEVFYPINNTHVGGGTLKDIKIISNGETNFTFPFSINYQTSLDTNGKILADLITKCGTSRTNLNLDYKITLGLKILATTISPSISNSLNFECPLDASDLSSLLRGGKRDVLDELSERDDLDVPPGLA